eukprot:scaffold1131_cov278-Chaetoceros_neogracile.AAC.5
MIRCALTRCPALFYVMITKSSGKPSEVAGAIVEITGGAEFLEIARDTSLGEMNGDFEILVSPVCMVPPCQCNALQHTSIHFKALQGTSRHFNALQCTSMQGN